MKYANICFDNCFVNDSDEVLCNIGDYLQFITIQRLYDKLGIGGERIVNLNIAELTSYEGECLILPLNYSIFNKNFLLNGRFAISKKIIPIFLACTLHTIGMDGEQLLKDEYNLNYLKSFEPIGCRDEYTLKKLRDFGILSYLTGCLTITQPKRNLRNIKPNKVFFIDTPYLLKDYIPSNLFENCEFTTQQYYLSYSSWFKNTNRIFSFVEEYYQKIANEACLVVTSRLHAATPCIAMGIPVILAKDYIDYRFAWLDKFIKLYSLNEYHLIDWNPKTIDIENHKTNLLNSAVERIQEVYTKYSSICDISDFYENRSRVRYYDFFEITHMNFDILDKFIDQHWNRNDEVEFAIWGITSATNKILQHIFEKYPNAKLVKVIDSFRDIVYDGIPSIKPCELTPNDDFYTIVTSVGASNVAKELFDRIGKKESTYCLMGSVFLNKS